MKIALFFSYGISLLDWKNNGTLNREIKIYKELSKLGYKFFFITYGDTRDLNLINDKNIEIIPLFKNGNRNKIVKIIKTIFIPFILRKKLNKIDILKTNQLTASLPAVLSKFFFKKPLILRLGYEPLQQINHLNKYSKFLRLTIKYLFKFFYLKSSLISTSSLEIKNFIIKEYKINKNKIFFNWNYVEIDKFKPLNQIKNDRLLFIGRLVEVKNIFLLLNAIKGTKIGLDIIGEGYLKKEIINFINVQKLDVKILPCHDNNQLPKIINKYSIYILCSRIEGNPKTLLEVMSCGIPVIGTDVKGIKEVISHNYNGILSIDNEIELRNNILKLYANKKKQNILSNNARQLITKHCSLENYLDYEINTYKLLI